MTYEPMQSSLRARPLNGNLLLNVGPMADGTIPEFQLSHLRALGAWLQVNGEAIFDTRPWVRAEGSADDGTAMRFTRRGDTLYTILLGTPARKQIKLRDVSAPVGAAVTLLGRDDNLVWSQEGQNLTVTMPGGCQTHRRTRYESRPMPDWQTH